MTSVNIETNQNFILGNFWLLVAFFCAAIGYTKSASLNKKFSGFYILYSSQYDHYVLGIVSVIEVINTTLTIFFFSIIGAVILSWVAPNSPHPMLQIIEEISSKLLAPIRKFIPSAGGLDFSPIFALILIRQLEILLASIISSII